MVMRLKTLDTLDVAHKTVLVRVDFNSDLHKGNIVLSPRITAPLETIRELRKRKAKVVLLAHQGRKGSWDYTSLGQHASLLKRYLKLTYVPDVIGKRARQAIAGLKEGEVLLLENVRSLSDETEFDRNNSLVKALLPLIDCYVNDAFSVSHRSHASIVGFAKHVPSAMGRVMQREVEGASKLNISRALLVLGGSKPEDNALLARALPKNRILANGLFGPYCLTLQGHSLGKESKLFGVKPGQDALPRNVLKSIITPVDFGIERKGKRVDIALGDLPVKEEIFDIGPATIGLFSREILEAKAVFFKGLSGLCNTDEFSIGTRVLLKALEYSKAYTVVCGGHTVTALDRFKIDRKKLGHVSLAGGALVHYLAGEKLPGLEVLS